MEFSWNFIGTQEIFFLNSLIFLLSIVNNWQRPHTQVNYILKYIKNVLKYIKNILKYIIKYIKI